MVQLAGRPCEELSLGDNPEVFTLVENLLDSTAGQVGPVSDATLVRLVGELWLTQSYAAANAANSSQKDVFTIMGIYIADINQQNNVLPLSPIFTMQSKDWLWTGSFHSTRSVIAGGSVLNSDINNQSCEGSNANGSHLDIRVKRKVRKGEGIFLATQSYSHNIFGDSLAATVFFGARLRALVLLP